MKKIGLASALACLFCTVSLKAQSTWIVDALGGGTHTTITAAVATAVNGDTIKVLAGTYTENVVVTEKLIFIGQAGAVVQSASQTFQFNTGSGGSVLSGFTLLDGDVQINSFPTNDATRIIIANNSFEDAQIDCGGVVVIASNTFYRGAANVAIYFDSPGAAGNSAVIFNNSLRQSRMRILAGYVDIVSNRIDSCGSIGIELPYVNSGVQYGNLKIVANVIDSCTTGMFFANCNVASANRVIANNVISNCPTGMSFSPSGQAWSGVFHNNVVYNSTVSSFTGTTPSTSTMNLYGNIASNCAGNASVSNSVWDYNCFFSSGTVPGGTGNISSNPLFVDPANGNFALQGGSPAINTGHPAVQYTDIDKTRNDMGVYGGTFTFTNFPGGFNAKVIDLLLSPASVVQGNNITITGKGISK
jgi:hypothetical protein